jgi:S-adenosyl-L-methionine hydrolase (adenosine-forming)
LVTLTSDIGAAYAAQMKAVLAHSVPPGRIVDLAHDLPAHDVRQAAFLLRAMAAGFPAGTIHVAVVDPGVGGRRAPLVVRCADGSLLVGPDNGVLAPLAEVLGAPKAFRIDPRRLPPRPRVGSTFDGRDLFSPTAALLANGARPEGLGSPSRFEPIALPRARRSRTGAVGEVIHADRFGNLISNIPTEWVPSSTEAVAVTVGEGARARRIPWVASYEAIPRSALGALGSSFGLVEIAVAQGSAARRLRARAGARVGLRWAELPSTPVRR